MIYFAIFLSLIYRELRDIRKDSQALLRNHHPRATIRNAGNIPGSGPFLLTMNHYSRPGFFILWAALEICAALPQPSIWLMTAAWTNRSGGFDRLRTWFTRLIFKRLAEIYGLVTMPAMPPALGDAGERALSIRRLLRKLREQPDAILCIAPEGMDFPGGILGEPFPGSGKLLLQAANLLNRILPVGVYEEDKRLVIKFGKPYILDEPSIHAEIDRQVADQVMRKIAALLPEKMRGVYG